MVAAMVYFFHDELLLLLLDDEEEEESDGPVVEVLSGSDSSSAYIYNNVRGRWERGRVNISMSIGVRIYLMG